MELTREQIVHLKELVLEMFEARDKAVIIASSTLEDRLHGMNEFRDALREQASTFISRPEHDVLINQINAVQLQAQSHITRGEMEVVRGMIDRNDAKISAGNTRMASLQTQLYLGGAGIVVILSVLQLLFNIWHPI